jgi:hypothetical protein
MLKIAFIVKNRANKALQLTSQYAISLRCTLYCQSANLNRQQAESRLS